MAPVRRHVLQSQPTANGKGRRRCCGPWPYSKAPIFRHDPLKLDGHSIRVVRVLPQQESSDIIDCTIETIPLSNDHVCLSYTWGTDRASYLIRLNGKLLAVRRNLWAFLDHARRLSINDPLWIDAISINQSSKKEKNHQVKRMADIYSKAQRVFIWLGSSGIHLTERIPNWHIILRKLAADLPVSFSDNTSVAAIFYDRLLKAIAQAEYWTRTWIIQEVLLSSEQLFLIVDTAFVAIHTFYKEFSTYVSRHSSGYCTNFGRFGRSLALTTENMDTTEFLRLSARSQCRNKRDRIYGLLGICPALLHLEVDYEISRVEVARRVIEHLKQGDLAKMAAIVDALVEALGIDVRTSREAPPHEPHWDERPLKQRLPDQRLSLSERPQRQPRVTSALQSRRWWEAKGLSYENSADEPEIGGLSPFSRPSNPRPYRSGMCYSVSAVVNGCEHVLLVHFRRGRDAESFNRMRALGDRSTETPNLKPSIDSTNSDASNADDPHVKSDKTSMAFAALLSYQLQTHRRWQESFQSQAGIPNPTDKDPGTSSSSDTSSDTSPSQDSPTSSTLRQPPEQTHMTMANHHVHAEDQQCAIFEVQTGAPNWPTPANPRWRIVLYEQFWARVDRVRRERAVSEADADADAVPSLIETASAPPSASGSEAESVSSARSPSPALRVRRQEVTDEERQQRTEWAMLAGSQFAAPIEAEDMPEDEDLYD
jgi:hypothetical protein